MAQTAPLAPITARPAAPPPLSLIAAASTPQQDPTVRWEAGGVTYAPEGCSPHGVIDPCSNAGFGPAQPTNPTIAAAVAFIVWAADDCSAFGFEERDWEGRARRALLAATPFEVEREFWAGVLSKAAGYGNRFLADSSHLVDITPAGGAVTPLNGLACLEQALGDTSNGGQGMIHATRKAALALSNNGVLRRQGNLLLTDVDTVVVPGVGYSGFGPSLAAPANVVATPGTNAGATLANDTYEYVVTATSATGETLPSTQVAATVTAGGTGQVVLTWNAVAGATGYNVYGRQAGAQVLLGSTAAAVHTFTDTGAAAASGATPPTVDTSGATVEGEHFMYATDYVTVLLSDPQIFAAGDNGLGTRYGVFDANVNTLRNRAERLAAVTFDGCRHFGIRVQVASCGGSI